jgi:3-oxoacyl-(acyl-carrier-protein) reductase
MDAIALAIRTEPPHPAAEPPAARTESFSQGPWEPAPRKFSDSAAERDPNTELKGKVCFITGGSRGIGRAIAMAMADAGADVALTYLSSKEKAEDVCRAIQEKGVRGKAYRIDASSFEETQQVVRQVIADFGPINSLVNNAGITRDKSFLRMTREMWDEVLHVNLDGVFNTTKAILPSMIEAGWGRILNLSSIVGQIGNFGQTNYAATKGAVISFTETLARELARKNITVNAVAPGFIETDMTKDLSEAAMEQVKAQTPIGRLGTPEEIAHVILFLASPRSAYITGQTLSVNGGMHM